MSRPDWSDRPALAELIASDWATSEAGPTLKWAQTLPDDLREPPVKSAFYAWLEKDFNAARAAFDASAPEAKSLMLSAMLGWAPKEQLGELGELVAHEPIAATRVEAGGILMRQWVKQDPTAASEWLAQQQPGEAQDRAIASFVVDWASEHEPQAALEWAGSISEPKLRWRHLEVLAKRYRDSDPAMARTWLDGTTRLSEDERARFQYITGK